MTTNQITFAEECTAGVELQVRTKLGNSFEVIYTLIHLTAPKSLYIITAECGDEHEGICVGRDRSKAIKILSLISEHGVFPEVLDETVREIEV
jgi:hypothetical protein